MAIIGISGKMGSGKDTLGKILCELAPQYEIKKYATKLKQIASLLSGIPIKKFKDEEFKKNLMSSEWWTLNKPTPAYGDMYNSMSVREFLQRIGTDALRDGLHPDVWVNALMADYKVKSTFKGVTNYNTNPIIEYVPNWIITDVRFPNEVQAIVDRGGIIIRINRTDKSRINADHPSETALDNWDGFNYVIDNNGTIEDLHAHAEAILKLEVL